MRLWHEALLPYLSRQRLVRQHCECCALRGNGWGKKHSTVDYAFKHSPERLYKYHLKVIAEMQRRGYDFEGKWLEPTYRGKYCEPWNFKMFYMKYGQLSFDSKYVFEEHNDEYLKECLEILDRKGEHIDYDIRETI